MGKTVRYFALAVLGLGLSSEVAAQSAAGMVVEGIDLRVTSGTLELNRVIADSARLSDDAGSVITESLRIEARTSDDRAIQASAPSGLVAIAGSRPRTILPRPDMAGIIEYAQNFALDAGYGDVLLSGDEQPAQATIGDDSFLRSAILIWSERFGCVLIPTSFAQQIKLSDGSEIQMTGTALSVDRDFRQWTFYGSDAEPARFEFVPQSTTATGAPK